MKTLYYFSDSENSSNLHEPVRPPCFCDRSGSNRDTEGRTRQGRWRPGEKWQVDIGDTFLTSPCTGLPTGLLVTKEEHQLPMDRDASQGAWPCSSEQSCLGRGSVRGKGEASWGSQAWGGPCASSGDRCTARPSNQQEIPPDQEIKVSEQEEHHMMGGRGGRGGTRHNLWTRAAVPWSLWG